jgi:methylmalonyl-CoA mutase N-terminal domain/subunit
VDPVGGSYAIEALTDGLKKEVDEYLQRIKDLGGMLAAIESGWIQAQIHESAYKYQQSIESKERIVVGVNEFRMDEEQKIPIHRADPSLEAAQVESLARERASRDNRAIQTAMAKLEQAARGSQNLMPHIIQAVEAYATVGEISDVFRRIYGEYREVWTV